VVHPYLSVDIRAYTFISTLFKEDIRVVLKRVDYGKIFIEGETDGLSIGRLFFMRVVLFLVQ
jgi:hypothetical protein